MEIDKLREYKLAGYAIFDLGASFLGIYLLAPWLNLLSSLRGVKRL